VFIDLFSGVTPEIVRPSEHIVTTAVLASSVYTLLAMLEMRSLSFFPVTLIAALVAFVFRVFAVRDHWPQIRAPSRSAVGPSRAREPLLKRAGGSFWFCRRCATTREGDVMDDIWMRIASQLAARVSGQ